MAGRASGRMSALTLPVNAKATAKFLPYRSRTPLFSLTAGGVMVTLTMPERLSAAEVEFARVLAAQAAAYAVEVERLYRSGRKSPGRSAGKGCVA
ncbi:hypothetical protein ACSNOI_08785 [Actinomadura kijaniata]|uniref:hypothetical protein n=1 Tax=Actinomadura kijaniata TaxID=46161 RepID=UPI003F1BD91A